MHRTPTLARDLYFGFDAERFYLRLDLVGPSPPGDPFDLRLEFIEPRPLSLRVPGLVPGERPVVLESEDGRAPAVTGATCRIGALLELGLPFASVGLEPGESVALLVQVLREGQAFESYPGEQGITFTVPDADFEASMWSA